MRLGGLSAKTIINALERTTKELSTTMEHLSSGLRINKAADDAASLAISEGLRVKSRITGQALLNANDGISFTNIQNGAIEQLTAILQRQGELAEQAANGTYSTQQRKALDAEGMRLSDEFNRIIATTEFNGLNVFSTANVTTLAVGETGQDTLWLAQLGMGGTSYSSTWDGTFSAALNITLASGNISHPIGADIDRDGDLDLIAGNATSAEVQVFFNNDSGQFTAGATYATASAPMGVAVEDFNNDGRIDIVTANSDGDTTVLLADASGGYTRRDYGADLGCYGRIRTVDLNLDGRADYVVNGENQVGIFIQNGTDFSVSYITDSPGAAVGDMDRDGFPDLITNNDTTGNSQFYRNQGNGTFVPGATLTGIGGNSAAIGDVNNDGFNDLVVNGWAQSKLQVAFGNGNGTFQAVQVYNHGYQTNGTALADINGDRNLDIVIAGYSGGGALTYLNSGNGRFVSSSAGASIIASWGAAPGDFNGDGVLDLVAGNWGSAAMVHFGGNNNSNLPYFDLRSAATAAKSLDGIRSRLEQLGTLTGKLGAVQSRIETSAGLLAVKKDQLLAADSRIRDADIADEAAKSVMLTIKQQTAAGLLAGLRGQETAVISSLLNF